MNWQVTDKKKPEKGFMYKIYKQPPELNAQRENNILFF